MPENMDCCRKFTLVCLLSLVVATVFSQSKNPIYLDYIRKYKDIAIEHQKRYKIPASITLAQGLIESAAGTSELAKKSNNHFGIKCHNSWEGKRVYHDDDAKGECFRKYRNPKDSYEDHALFLTKSPRYGNVVAMQPTKRMPVNLYKRSNYTACTVTTEKVSHVCPRIMSITIWNRSGDYLTW